MSNFKHHNILIIYNSPYIYWKSGRKKIKDFFNIRKKEKKNQYQQKRKKKLYYLFLDSDL